MSSTLRKLQKRSPNYKADLYYCDPNKNVNCKNRFKEGWCGVDCKCTVHRNFSKGNKKYTLPERKKDG